MLLCDRCKKPIVGESKKLLDVCPDCYYLVMTYISTGNTGLGISQARIIGRLGRRLPTRILAIFLLMIVLLTVSSYFALSTYAQYEAPFQNERGLANALAGNLTQEQSTVQAAATVILRYESENQNLSSKVASLNQTLVNDDHNITSLVGTVQQLKLQSSSLQNTVSILKNNITLLEEKGGTFVIWNVPVNVSAGYFLFETVPDTFDYHDNFSATVPIDVFYFNRLSVRPVVHSSDCLGRLLELHRHSETIRYVQAGRGLRWVRRNLLFRDLRDDIPKCVCNIQSCFKTNRFVFMI